MQTPVRYYITQSDDRAVVRTVPVAVQVPEIEPETNNESVQATAPVAQQPDARDQARITRLVRAAASRAKAQR